MRKSTFFWLALTAVCGIMLFHTSQKVNDGRIHLAELEKNTEKEKETLRVLEAEWSYLNQPERLDKLARTHLKLAPMKSRQFISLADLDKMPQVAATVTPAPEPSSVKIQKPIEASPLASAALPPVKDKFFVWSPQQQRSPHFQKKAGR